ncbi:MAG: aminopeptidase P family protein [Candidatus Izemoplasmatales bacterium]|jgi:Xaa-Pro aminopeptidase
MKIQKEELIKRRQALFSMMQKRSLALVYSGEAPHKTLDQFYAYTPNRNFQYLTGIARERFVLVMLKKDVETYTFLFIESDSEEATKWTGKRLMRAEASEISGIPLDDIGYVADLPEFLSQKILSDSRKSLIGMPKILYLDLYRPRPLTKPISMLYAQDIIENYPELALMNLCELIDQLRRVKSTSEIALIQEAIQHTRSGIERMMKEAKVGMNERALASLFEYQIKQSGSEGLAFNTTVAGGPRAVVLHYEDNDQSIEDPSLVLCDLGAVAGGYNADITRTFPINGRFTPRQKQLYEAVLEVNKAVIDQIRPGVMVKDLNAFAKDELANRLLGLGIIKDKMDVDRYYYHSVSHYLGLDTHDVGTYQVPLEPGVVLTVEPGLYIPEEQIGIRIEDDVVVVEDGAINLSADIIKEVDEIESFMKR